MKDLPCAGNMCNSTTMPYEDSRQLLVGVYSIVFVVGVPTNFLTAALTLVQIFRKTITSIYLFGLSLCELMYVSTIPLWIIYVQNGHKWSMGEVACHVTGYIFFCNIYISILLLCCISVDRYIAVAYALESRGKRSQTIATVVTLGFSGLVLVIYCPVFFLKDVQDQNITTCFETPLNTHLAYYNIVRFFVGFFIPFALLIFMNYKIFQTIKFSMSLSPHQKAKVKYLAISIISIFVVCFAPYHLVLFVRSIIFLLNPAKSCQFERDIYTTSVVFLCLSTANSVADPFIYVLASENARREIHRTFRACGIRLPIGPKTESNTANDTLKTPKGPWTPGNKGVR